MWSGTARGRTRNREQREIPCPSRTASTVKWPLIPHKASGVLLRLYSCPSELSKVRRAPSPRAGDDRRRSPSAPAWGDRLCFVGPICGCPEISSGTMRRSRPAPRGHPSAKGHLNENPTVPVNGARAAEGAPDRGPRTCLQVTSFVPCHVRGSPPAPSAGHSARFNGPPGGRLLSPARHSLSGQLDILTGQDKDLFPFSWQAFSFSFI